MNQNFCFLGIETGISQNIVLKMHSHPRQSSSPSLSIVLSRRTLCCPTLEQIPVITRNKERVMTSSFITQLTIKRILDIFFFFMWWGGKALTSCLEDIFCQDYIVFIAKHTRIWWGEGIERIQHFCSQQQKRLEIKSQVLFKRGLCNLELEEAFKISEGAKNSFCSAGANWKLTSVGKWQGGRDGSPWLHWERAETTLNGIWQEWIKQRGQVYIAHQCMQNSAC